MKIDKQLLKGKNFCILPWIHFHAWPDGKTFPCCIADSNRPVSSTNSESIIKMMNSQDFNELRLRMLNNQASEICQRCYDLENLGIHSLRQSHTESKLESLFDYISNATNDDGSLTEFKLKYLDIRFSNICNMKCRSCGPSCSSQWAQEYQERYSPETLQSRFGLAKIVVSNNEGDVFWEKLKPYLDDVEEVYFAGGEALITPEHYKILDYWLEKGKTDVKVTYTTNFSVLRYKDKQVFDYWRKFPKVEIYASLDASGPIAEFMRKGTDWAQIEENAKLVKSELPHVRFEITPTISLWNIFQFPKFHQDWIEKGFLSKKQDIRLNILTFPWYASLMILPKFIREKARKLYEPVVNDESYSQSIRNGYQSVLNALDSAEENRPGIKEFFKFNNELDVVRQEQILEIIPELKEIYEWAHNN